MSIRDPMAFVGEFRARDLEARGLYPMRTRVQEPWAQRYQPQQVLGCLPPLMPGLIPTIEQLIWG